LGRLGFAWEGAFFVLGAVIRPFLTPMPYRGGGFFTRVGNFFCWGGGGGEKAELWGQLRSKMEILEREKRGKRGGRGGRRGGRHRPAFGDLLLRGVWEYGGTERGRWCFELGRWIGG